MFVINEEKNFQLKRVWPQNSVSSKQGTDIILGVGWGRNWGSLNPQVVFFLPRVDLCTTPFLEIWDNHFVLESLLVVLLEGLGLKS